LLDHRTRGLGPPLLSLPSFVPHLLPR